jgi:hypothetical protein
VKTLHTAGEGDKENNRSKNIIAYILTVILKIN